MQIILSRISQALGGCRKKLGRRSRR